MKSATTMSGLHPTTLQAGSGSGSDSDSNAPPLMPTDASYSRLAILMENLTVNNNDDNNINAEVVNNNIHVPQPRQRLANLSSYPPSSMSSAARVARHLSKQSISWSELVARDVGITADDIVEEGSDDNDIDGGEKHWMISTPRNASSAHTTGASATPGGFFLSVPSAIAHKTVDSTSPSLASLPPSSSSPVSVDPASSAPPVRPRRRRHPIHSTPTSTFTSTATFAVPSIPLNASATATPSTASLTLPTQPFKWHHRRLPTRTSCLATLHRPDTDMTTVAHSHSTLPIPPAPSDHNGQDRLELDTGAVLEGEEMDRARKLLTTILASSSSSADASLSPFDRFASSPLSAVKPATRDTMITHDLTHRPRRNRQMHVEAGSLSARSGKPPTSPRLHAAAVAPHSARLPSRSHHQPIPPKDGHETSTPARLRSRRPLALNSSPPIPIPSSHHDQRREEKEFNMAQVSEFESKEELRVPLSTIHSTATPSTSLNLTRTHPSSSRAIVHDPFSTSISALSEPNPIPSAPAPLKALSRPPCEQAAYLTQLESTFHTEAKKTLHTVRREMNQSFNDACQKTMMERMEVQNVARLQSRRIDAGSHAISDASVRAQLHGLDNFQRSHDETESKFSAKSEKLHLRLHLLAQRQFEKSKRQAKEKESIRERMEREALRSDAIQQRHKELQQLEEKLAKTLEEDRRRWATDWEAVQKQLDEAREEAVERSRIRKRDVDRYKARLHERLRRTADNGVLWVRIITAEGLDRHKLKSSNGNQTSSCFSIHLLSAPASQSVGIDSEPHHTRYFTSTDPNPTLNGQFRLDVYEASTQLLRISVQTSPQDQVDAWEKETQLSNVHGNTQSQQMAPSRVEPSPPHTASSRRSTASRQQRRSGSIAHSTVGPSSSPRSSTDAGVVAFGRRSGTASSSMRLSWGMQSSTTAPVASPRLSGASSDSVASPSHGPQPSPRHSLSPSSSIIQRRSSAMNIPPLQLPSASTTAITSQSLRPRSEIIRDIDEWCATSIPLQDVRGEPSGKMRVRLPLYKIQAQAEKTKRKKQQKKALNAKQQKSEQDGDGDVDSGETVGWVDMELLLLPLFTSMDLMMGSTNGERSSTIHGQKKEKEKQKRRRKLRISQSTILNEHEQRKLAKQLQREAKQVSLSDIWPTKIGPTSVKAVDDDEEEENVQTPMSPLRMATWTPDPAPETPSSMPLSMHEWNLTSPIDPLPEHSITSMPQRGIERQSLQGLNERHHPPHVTFQLEPV